MSKRNYNIDEENRLKERLREENSFRCYWYHSMKRWIENHDIKRVKRSINLFQFWSTEYEITKALLEQLQRTK